MRIFRGVADLQDAVGQHLGHSEWFTVTQQQVDLFAEATGDHQWIHVDPVRAAEGPFGTTIAHGYLTLSLVPMLVAQIYSIEAVALVINYGADKLRFPAPVPVGARIRAGVELASVEPGSAGYQVVARVTIECEGSAKPACVVETVTVVVP